MRTLPRIESELEFKESAPSSAARSIWKAMRLPLVGILTLLEPAVRYVCSFAMVLGIIASVAFEISAVGPRFPFLGMLALSFGFGVVLFLYYGLSALLSR
jgi:hypothetical protein